MLEAAIIDFYGKLRFPEDMAGQMRTQMQQALEEEEHAEKLLHQQLTSELGRLDRQEENLLDLISDGTETSIKVRERLNVIQRKRNVIREQLSNTRERLEVGAALLEDALRLLTDPQDLYQQMAPEQRRLMNLAIFDKLYVFDDTVDEAVFNPPFDDLLAIRDQWTWVAPEHPDGSDPEHLSGIFLDGVSSKDLMVEVTRFELATSTMRT